MAELHELLAVDRTLETKVVTACREAVDLFRGERNVFTGKSRELRMFDEADKHEEKANAEYLELQVTVGEVLEQVSQHVTRYIDALTEKELTNQAAHADIVLPNGSVVARNVPATALLALEKVLGTWKQIFDHAPTLPHGVSVQRDDNASRNGHPVYVISHPIVRLRTRNMKQPLILHPATDKHPAQVDVVAKDVPVGEWTETHWYGMVPQSVHDVMVERIEQLRDAIKQARMRANSTKVISVIGVGRAMQDWIMTGSAKAVLIGDSRG